jgi:hypothetical protein
VLRSPTGDGEIRDRTNKTVIYWSEKTRYLVCASNGISATWGADFRVFEPGALNPTYSSLPVYTTLTNLNCSSSNALALVASNALPYQPWSSVLTPANNLQTSLVAFADGTLPLLVCTGAQTVGVNIAGGWGAAGINRFSLALWTGSWTVTLQSNTTVRWGAPISLSTTRTNHVMFRGNGTNDWTIIQIP